MANIRIKGTDASYWRPVQGGANFKMTLLGDGRTTLVLSMEEGTYLAPPPEESDPSEPQAPQPSKYTAAQPVLTINGASPMDDGMFMIRGDECNSIDYLQTPNKHGLVQFNNCVPCENCADVLLLKARYEYYLIWFYLLLNANIMDDEELLEGLRSLAAARIRLSEACSGNTTLELPAESPEFTPPPAPGTIDSLPDGVQGVRLLRQYQTLVQMWNALSLKQADSVELVDSSVSPYGFVPRVKVSLPFCEAGEELAGPFEPGPEAYGVAYSNPVAWVEVKVWTEDERFEGCVFATVPQIITTPTTLVNGVHYNAYVKENKCTSATLRLDIIYLPGMTVCELAFHVLPFYEVEYWHKRVEAGGVNYTKKFDLTKTVPLMPSPVAVLVPYGRIREYIPLDIKPVVVEQDNRDIDAETYARSQYIPELKGDPVPEDGPDTIIWQIRVQSFKRNENGTSVQSDETYSYEALLPKRPDLEVFGGPDQVEDTDYTYDRYVLPDDVEPYPYPSDPYPSDP